MTSNAVGDGIKRMRKFGTLRFLPQLDFCCRSIDTTHYVQRYSSMMFMPGLKGLQEVSSNQIVYLSVCFYTPVFRRDVLWYGDVRPSALFSYMLWHIDLKFCVSLYFYACKIKFECHQFLSLFAGVMLLFNFKLLQICSFPHFSPTCFDILSSNFV